MAKTRTLKGLNQEEQKDHKLRKVKSTLYLYQNGTEGPGYPKTQVLTPDLTLDSRVKQTMTESLNMTKFSGLHDKR